MVRSYGEFARILETKPSLLPLTILRIFLEEMQTLEIHHLGLKMETTTDLSLHKYETNYLCGVCGYLFHIHIFVNFLFFIFLSVLLVHHQIGYIYVSSLNVSKT